MGRRTFRPISVSRQFLAKRWKKTPPEWKNQAGASESGKQMPSGSAGASTKSSWELTGSTEYLRGHANGQSAPYKFAGIFPFSFEDHHIREMYHLDCIDEKDSTCNSLQSAFSVFVEVKAYSADSAAIASHLIHAASQVGLPVSIRPSEFAETESPVLAWKAHCFAPRERTSEKVQLFLLRPVLPIYRSAQPSDHEEWIHAIQQTFIEHAPNMSISGYQFVPFHADGSRFQAVSLAGVQHRCIVRSMRRLDSASDCNVASNGRLAGLFRAIQTEGFINYFPAVKLGLVSTEHLNFARHLFSPDFRACVVTFLKDMRGTDERLHDVWRNVFRSDKDLTILFGQPAFLRHLQTVLDDHRIENKHIHSVIGRLVSCLENKQHNPFQDVLKRCVPFRIAEVKIRAVTEICFNTMASLRLREYGGRVVPGDLVLPRNALPSRFEHENRTQQVHQTAIDPQVSAIPFEMVRLQTPECLPIRVRDENHSKGYFLSDVVLPVVYPLQSARSIVLGIPEKVTPKRDPLWPAHAINRKVYQDFLRRIGFSDDFLHQKEGKNGPSENIGYRHLIAKPINLRSYDGASANEEIENPPDDFRWEIHSACNVLSSPPDGRTSLTERTTFSEISSCPSELAQKRKNTQCCIRLKGSSEVSQLAQRTGGTADSSRSPMNTTAESMTAALEMVLPPDAFLDAALREAIDISAAKVAEEHREWKGTHKIKWKKAVAKTKKRLSAPDFI